MEGYFLFILIAVVTIFSPGPGVLLTLTNSIRYGMSGAIGAIVGIAFGTFIIAAVSATSVGVLLATSALAFTILKFIGATYLIYLGIKLWRTPNAKIQTNSSTRIERRTIKLQFIEGLILQITNPKAVFFFISIFPQFVDYTTQYLAHFVLLVVTYSCLVLIIHFLYAYLAKSARKWFNSEKGSLIVKRTSGGTFVLFGIGLASASK